MRLHLPTPPGWRHRPNPLGSLLVSPEGNLTIIVTSLFPAPTNKEGWLCRALSLNGEQPASREQGTTADGWHYHLLEVGGPRPSLGAYLEVADLGGAMIARCRSVEQRPGWRREVLTLLGSARPDFRDAEAACLAEQLRL
jgi:hypothetical protein